MHCHGASSLKHDVLGTDDLFLIASDARYANGFALRFDDGTET
jgi:hypothetical protein